MVLMDLCEVRGVKKVVPLSNTFGIVRRSTTQTTKKLAKYMGTTIV